MTILTYSEWISNDYLKIKTDKIVHIVSDIILNNIYLQNLEKGIIIYFMAEPYAFKPYIRKYILEYYKYYDYILTYDEEVLIYCPNALFFNFHCPWVKNFNDFKNKKFEISSIVNNKLFLKGHYLRLNFYINKNLIKIPNTFFLSKKDPITNLYPDENNYINKDRESKHIMFTKFKYTIVIENSRQNNYFTEKLLDALITKTIPIYYGAPNIDIFFDTSGWIILTSDDLLENINKINNIKDEYEKHLLTIEENYKKVIDIGYEPKNIEKIISKILNNDLKL